MTMPRYYWTVREFQGNRHWYAYASQSKDYGVSLCSNETWVAYAKLLNRFAPPRTDRRHVTCMLCAASAHAP